MQAGAIIVSDKAVEPKSLKDKIQELWSTKVKEASVIAEGRSRKAEDERWRDSLNWAFEHIPVSLFPMVPSGKVIELRSDDSISHAVKVFSMSHILSAPVLNVDAPSDAGWIDRYLGMVDFTGIVMFVIEMVDKCINEHESFLKGTSSPHHSASPGSVSSDMFVGVHKTHKLSLEKLRSSLNSKQGDDFFHALCESELFEQTKVQDITDTFRWAPFVPVQTDDSLLTLLLLMSRYRMKAVPVVEAGQGSLCNLISQSAVVEVLAECDGLPWFNALAEKTLNALGLPVMPPEKVIKIEDDRPVLEPFLLMMEHGIGGVAVVKASTSHLIGNISARDVRFLLFEDVFKNRSKLTIRDFMEIVLTPHGNKDEIVPLIRPPITCQVTESLSTVIGRLHTSRIHRLFVTDENGDVVGVVTLRDIIGKFVYEPHGYFGDFFAGVLPL